MARRLDTRAPPSLRALARLFSALEFGLGALTLYQHTPDFAAVKRAVESSCQLSFTPKHLQQILHILPGAYALQWKRRPRRRTRQAGDDAPVLTLRKQQLPPPDSAIEGLQERITLFYSKLNAFLEGHVAAIRKEFPDMTDEELEKALKLIEVDTEPLPEVPKELEPQSAVAALDKKLKEKEPKSDDAKSEEKLEQALAKPVPSDLQTLPEWLINKVRKQELGRKDVEEKSAKVQKKRLLSTLPQLTDQLQSLVMVTRKSVFAKSELVKRLAARAPIKGKVEEQIDLLESMVPEWVTIVIDDGKEYVKISTSVKYSAVKTSLRRAIAIQA